MKLITKYKMPLKAVPMVNMLVVTVTTLGPLGT